MVPFDIFKAASAIGGELVNAAAKAEITNVVIDSRKAGKGSLFVAIKGERSDGHDYINDVFAKGASCVLCDHVPEGVTGPCIVVKDTVKGLQEIAKQYRSERKARVIGITGSVGKTSTKEMVAGTLSAKFKVLKTEGNYNNEIGLPLTVLNIEEETEIAVLEMGISDFGEMRVLSRIARPDICVITNIGQAHLEFLKSRDGILKAKSEIFEFMNPNGSIYLNGDDDKLSTLRNVNGITPVFYGFNSSNDAYPTDVCPLSLEGSTMTLHYKDMELKARITIPGSHMVMNAVVAAAIAYDLHMTSEEIAEGLFTAKTISGRCNIIKTPKGGYIIDDCYNASPNSMKAAIDTLTLSSERKVAILGDMFELGEDSDRMHAEVGRYAVKSHIDKLICVGANCKYMYEAASDADTTVKTVYYPSLDELLLKLSEETDGSESILVKSSNGMGFSKLVEKLKEL